MRDRLSLKEILVMSGALFSMHFGASCMLYPVTWGKESGTAVWLAYAGILLSDILLPFLAYLSFVRGKGDFLGLVLRITPKFGKVYAALVVLLIGPLFVVPRMSASAWDAVLVLTGFEFKSPLPTVIFSIIYYLIIFWFVSNSSKVIGRIGQILFPILIVIVTAVIAKALITPVSEVWTAPRYSEPPLVYGFLQGIETGDLLCALMFGFVIVRGIHNSNLKESAFNKTLITVGIIGLSILSLVHLGHMTAGANLGGTVDLTLSALYMKMVIILWGRVGGIVFNIALIAATLTSSIGCISSTSGLWEEILGGRVRYRAICLISCVVGCAVSSMGLNAVVSFVGPVLNACYPPAIVMTLYFCLVKNYTSPRQLMAVKCSMIAAAVMSTVGLADTYIELFGLSAPVFKLAYSYLPLSEYSFAWLPVSAAVYFVTFLICSVRKRKAA